VSKPKVILTRKWPDEAEKKAKELFDAVLNEDDHKMSIEELKEAMCNADALCPTVSDFQINSDVFGVENLKCKIVANFGVGYNNIDTNAAKEAGIVVTNTPDVLTDCTADIAMVLLLSVARRIGEGERLVRNKEWSGWCPTHMLSTKVTGKKLGFIGFGRIAQAVAQKAHFGFGMQISFYDPYPPSDEIVKKFSATKFNVLEDVLKDSDFVTLHCPGGGENTNLLNNDRFALMKNSAFLINTARGDVVDENALVQALKNNVIAGAGLDVYAKEPTVTEELLGMDNVVLIPHLGSATTETRVAMGLRSLENVKAFFDGKEPGDRVA
jgi:lactate dehydrogenase-like 2-hydroxyacid dehydrogenase|tara:strand:+ start:5859 stop:6833 length:975 start_codon:yes stop_codon:yes gene_type:complete